MIRIRIYWDGFYQGEFDSPVRLQRNDLIWGTLFRRQLSGEKFRIFTASPVDIFLDPEFLSNEKVSKCSLTQDVHVTKLE